MAGDRARAGAPLLSFVMFVCAIAAVVVGFIGYYSRVSLISEFQQQGGNIDYVFMNIHQIDQDERDLRQRRNELFDLQKNVKANLIDTRATAFASKQYKAYLDTSSTVTLILYSALSLLTDDYLVTISKVDYSAPDLAQAQLFADLQFKPNTPADDRIKLYSQLGPSIQSFRQAIVGFNAQFGNQINQIANLDAATSSQLQSTVREILVRNPQWASPDDVKRFGLGDFKVDAAKQQDIAKQRAIVRAYEDALGWASWLLHAPTIVATLLVTLATGWLGGVVSYMGSAIRSVRVGSDVTAVEQPYVTLMRRSILGITAALGIFLFAGSGLLVLSSQSAKTLGSSSIELSPYFVAFLAFISGYLADDAFLRLANAGRSIFRSNGTVNRQGRGARGGTGSRSPAASGTDPGARR